MTPHLRTLALLIALFIVNSPTLAESPAQPGVVEQSKQTASEAADWAKDKARQGWDTTKAGANKAADWGQEKARQGGTQRGRVPVKRRIGAQTKPRRGSMRPLRVSTAPPTGQRKRSRRARIGAKTSRKACGREPRRSSAATSRRILSRPSRHCSSWCTALCLG